MIKTLQQGDVTLKRVSELPKGKIKKIKNDKRGIVLAEGEHTGHCHSIEEISDAELIQIGNKLLLQVDKPVTLKHQEHNAITIEPGIWEVGRIQEYDYYAQMSRPVAD